MTGDLIAVAMSGGVDSSVVAALLRREGRNIAGLTMQLWNHAGDGTERFDSCCSLTDVHDARQAAHRLGIPHYVVNYEREFKSGVVDYFAAEYAAGRTPNPCVMCNSKLKFDHLVDRAHALGADWVATGHFARVVHHGDGRPSELYTGRDDKKDQSYFLFHHTQATLPRSLFPLAHLTKMEVRQLGAELGLHLAEKLESQEICFVTQDRYDAFLEAEGRDPGVGEGDIRHLDGRWLGRHRGYWRHTVGQRRGLGVAYSEPLYVVRTDPANNIVWVGGETDLFARDLVARDLNWVQGTPTSPLACEARIRSRSPEAEALVIPLPDGGARVSFVEPQRAIAPGQAVVFYRDGEVLGGGWIDHRVV